MIKLYGMAQHHKKYRKRAETLFMMNDLREIVV